MERSDREIVEFMKGYKDKPESIRAMGDILAFMGLLEGVAFGEMALQEIQEENKHSKDLRNDYHTYLRNRKASEYISYEKYLQLIEEKDRE